MLSGAAADADFTVGCGSAPLHPVRCPKVQSKNKYALCFVQKSFFVFVMRISNLVATSTVTWPRGFTVRTVQTVCVLNWAYLSMFRRMFDTVASSLTARVDDLVKTVAERKASIEFTQSEVANLKPVLTKLEETNKVIINTKQSIALHKNKLEYMENQSRRNNIRVQGIPEAIDGETWNSTERKVKEAIRETLGIDPDIERAHRVERKPKRQRNSQTNISAQTTGPRTIVCRLRDWKQKEEILRKVRRVKPPGLFVSEDLAPETLAKREPQLAKLKEAKRAGKVAYFVLDRLVIKDRRPSQNSFQRQTSFT